MAAIQDTLKAAEIPLQSLGVKQLDCTGPAASIAIKKTSKQLQTDYSEQIKLFILGITPEAPKCMAASNEYLCISKSLLKAMGFSPL